MSKLKHKLLQGLLLILHAANWYLAHSVIPAKYQPLAATAGLGIAYVQAHLAIKNHDPSN